VRFKAEYLSQFTVQKVGGYLTLNLGPAERKIAEFNQHIVEMIEVIFRTSTAIKTPSIWPEAFRSEALAGFLDG